MKKIFGIISTLVILMVVTGCSLDTIRYWNGPDKGEVVQTVPCVSVEKVATVQAPVIKIKEVIFFDWDSNIVKPEGQVILDKVAKLMKENPDIQLQLKGYASEEGASTYNMGLSRRRVDAVKVELMMRGVKGTRMSTEAKGETTAFGDLLNLNRRTVILSVD
jgi:outer membrane protein OmpA-like peptidoglycan-associated protein